MKILLTLLLVFLTVLCNAQPSTTDGYESPLTMTCMFIILVIAMLIAAVVYLLVKNKQRGVNENNNSATNK